MVLTGSAVESGPHTVPRPDVPTSLVFPTRTSLSELALVEHETGLALAEGSTLELAAGETTLVLFDEEKLSGPTEPTTLGIAPRSTSMTLAAGSVGELAERETALVLRERTSLLGLARTTTLELASNETTLTNADRELELVLG